MSRHASVLGPLVFEPNDEVQVKRYDGSLDVSMEFDSVGALIREIYPNMKLIPCGGGLTPFQEREQWTDGSNLFALKSGVFYGYDRNYHTSETLEKEGYTVQSASLMNDEIGNRPDRTSQVDRHLITLPSGELSRARGGESLYDFTHRQSLDFVKVIVWIFLVILATY